MDEEKISIKRDVVFNKTFLTFKKSVTNSESVKEKITEFNQMLDEIFQSVKKKDLSKENSFLNQLHYLKEDSSKTSNQSNHSKAENSHDYVESDEKNSENEKNEKNKNNSSNSKNLAMSKSSAQFTKPIDTNNAVINVTNTSLVIENTDNTEKC